MIVESLKLFYFAGGIKLMSAKKTLKDV